MLKILKLTFSLILFFECFGLALATEQPKEQQELFEAAKTGQIEKVETLLSHGLKPDLENEGGCLNLKKSTESHSSHADLKSELRKHLTKSKHPPILIESGRTKRTYFYGDHDHLQKSAEVNYTFFSDRNFRESEGKIIENCHFDQLKKAQDYNFVVVESGEIVCGLVEDSWEIGVKHVSLADKRSVLLAGEVFIDPDGEIIFNLQSGTFMAPLTAHLSPEDEASENFLLSAQFAMILKQSIDSNHPVGFVTDSFERKDPTLTGVLKLCKTQFKRQNQTLCRTAGMLAVISKSFETSPRKLK